ncbi:hypothetical protein ACO3UB_07340 [Methanocaldococcus sp. 16A]
MDDKEIEERLEVLSKKILEIEKRVDAKLKENDKRLVEKAEKLLKPEVLLALGICLKTMDDIKKILAIIRVSILVLGILMVFLYFLVIALMLKIAKIF